MRSATVTGVGHSAVRRYATGLCYATGDAFVLCAQIPQKKRMTALLTVSLRNNSVLVSLKYSQHNAEIAFQ